MVLAKLDIQHQQVTVQVQVRSSAPIEIPMCGGYSYWQSQNKTVVINAESPLPFWGLATYKICIDQQLFNFRPKRYLHDGSWEGLISKI